MSVATSKLFVAHPADPEQYRMSIGEHLEELRWRLILALAGFVIIFIACLWYGNAVVAGFCRPLLVTLKSRGLPPFVYDKNLGGSFMVFMKISLVSAAAFAAPWMVYQIWLFVAAGLYPHERKWVMRYAPLSIALLVSGMLFVYFLVLPWTIQFFIDWTANMPIPDYSTNAMVTPEEPPPAIPFYKGDPDLAKVRKGNLWYNELEGKLNIVVGKGSDGKGIIRSIPFAPLSLVVPQYDLSDYIDLVVMMLLMFGLAFQLPLVVAALIKIGIFEPAQLRAVRKYIYFALLIIAAAITPGDVITATIALLFPLMLLYEFGILLGQWGGQKKEEEEEPAKSPHD